jgi:hypothetical protein
MLRPQQTQPPSPTPPVVQPSGGSGNATPPQQIVVVNGVTGYYDAAGTFVPLQGGMPSSAQEYFPAPRPAEDPRFAPQGWTQAQGPYQFDKEGVVLNNGRVLVDDQGNPRSYRFGDAVQEFNDMPTAAKNQLMVGLERKGFNVEDGRSQINALWYLMQLGNEEGIDWRASLIRFDNASPDLSKSVAAPRYTISNPSDVKTVANKTALSVLGREFTKDELARFTSSYQQAELGYQQQRSGVVTAAPDMQVAASEFAEQVAPTEANAYKYLGAVNMLMRNIGEL